MKDGGVLIWVLLVVVALVIWVQFNQQGFFSPGQNAGNHPAEPAWPQERAGTVTVFGHEFDETDVRQWYSKIEGRYCYRSGMVYAVGTAPGEAMEYEQFLAALKLGFYFPELEGAGVKSDGEKVILTHEHLRKRPKPVHKNKTAVHIN